MAATTPPTLPLRRPPPQTQQVPPEAMEFSHRERLKILFTLWDLDNSGYIEVPEFVLGLRKLQGDGGGGGGSSDGGTSSSSTHDIDVAIEQTVRLMVRFDQDGDQRLNQEEFCLAMQQFAHTMYISLHELIDFMVVESALRDNNERDEQYVQNLKRQLLRRVRESQQQYQQQQRRQQRRHHHQQHHHQPQNRPQWINNILSFRSTASSVSAMSMKST
mmetsp:Transcript_20994/g.35789  ORF Transcript_20994/g.35789 Transcript_20994/m.35789 type:complete len:217 (-) Transcript_20994:52-702(-)